MASHLTSEHAAPAPVEPVDTYEIHGGRGIRLHAREWGTRDGPAVLFLHGWSQCELCWSGQVGGELAASLRMVTFDLRGHGRSDKPLGSGHYGDARLWADDVAAVIDQTGLERPVLVAWSYGGFIVGDYLRAYGEEGIAGVNLVGGAVLLRPPTFDGLGPDLLAIVPDACAPDLPANIGAVGRLLRACTVEPLDDQVLTAALGWNMVVPPEIRGALLAREIDNDDVLARLTVPVLVTHGREDRIVLPSMAEHVLSVCETAVPSWYDGVGHMPFVEDAARFDRELAAFVERTRLEAR